MNQLPLEVQTLYAELMERLSARDARRSIGHVPGSFVTKEVKGERYAYFQYSDPGSVKRQVYVGRKDAVLDAVIARWRGEREQLAEETTGIRRLCSLLRVGGAQVTDAATARVLKALAEAGIFHTDGVLVGTHAFVVIGNLLGVKWTGASLMTQDIDIAAEASVSVALPDAGADVPGVLEGLEMGFLPVPHLDARKPSTSFKVRGRGLRVDLLTPLRGRKASGPLTLRRFNAAAQPLPFLDFLIERPVRGVIVDGGGVLVHVPDPARFGLHKLIVSGEREATSHTKREKDLRQAAQVLSVLLEERPGDINVAWDDIVRRGKGWTRRVLDGVSSLKRIDSGIGGRLAAALARPA